LNLRSKSVKDLTDVIDDLILVIDIKGENKYFELLKLDSFEARKGDFDLSYFFRREQTSSVCYCYLTGIKERCGYDTPVLLSQKLIDT
jgi:hypothetical protein